MVTVRIGQTARGSAPVRRSIRLRVCLRIPFPEDQTLPNPRRIQQDGAGNLRVYVNVNRHWLADQQRSSHANRFGGEARCIRDIQFNDPQIWVTRPSAIETLAIGIRVT